MIYLYNAIEVNKYKNELTKTKELISFIVDNDIIEYSDLLDILLKNDMGNMFDVASSHTLLFHTFIK